MATACALLLGCTADDPPPRDPPAPLPALGEVQLTDAATLIPSHAPIEAVTSRDPSEPDHRSKLLADRFGETETGEGEPHLPLTIDAADPPAPGPSPQLLTRFVHLADAQIVDDESPVRGAAYDVPGLGAFRPQEDHSCRILHAAVRTINRLHQQTPLDLVLLGGDNVDSAQRNELDWLVAILSGAPVVHCDSGEDNDPIEGANNDPKDRFTADGLDVPWLWVTGNHDVLAQGLQTIDYFAERAVGTFAVLGTRDWRLPGGPVVIDDVPADAARKLLTVEQVLTKVQSDGDGHGVDEAVMGRGKASYVHDIEGTSLRFIVIDSATPLADPEGLILQSDLDSFIRPALDDAVAKDKLVILASHHSSNTLSDGSALGGDPQPDALTEETWQAFVGGYNNILAHLTGHSHVHRVHRRESAPGLPYWEVITAALADYPHQMRVVEVWDQDNGFVSLRFTSLDYATEGDPIAAEGRRLGVLDYTSGWTEEARGEADDRNVELWVAKP